jgi:GNAT superfamily N-acetyltransferase
VHIERIDAADIDHALALELAAIRAREVAVDDPEDMAPSAEGIRLDLRYGHDDTPTEYLWVARDDAGGVIGAATLGLSHWDNPDLAFVGCHVDPSKRRHGVGSALLDIQLTCARDIGRRQLVSWSTADGAASEFLLSQGFTTGLRMAGRTIDPQACDADRLQALADGASAKAADYELVRIDGMAPPELLPSLCGLFEAINDAPLDDLEMAPDEFPPERVRGYELAMSHRRQHLYRILARRRDTGELAGHTIVCVDETRPGYAVQEDTSVVGAHRGHRLGMLLKVSMLQWIREAEPQIVRIDTGNAETNAHMIAVNEELGCRLIGHGVALQRSL